ncbi:Solute carrier family 35 member G1 [Holothuria leucospilota]|uniref:Solute carrier family 35 member G1 n=1 Tax=Holothuria leucospilota TaxID=206669 RepID=A0A9Q1BFQ2_HOLLE|nr:Solute carrier family 35 member G1 [Holothuria leucospilota]
MYQICKSFCVSSVGILFAFLCAVSFSTEDILLYAIKDDFHPTMVLVFNSNIGFILCLIVLFIIRPKKTESFRELLLVIIYGTFNVCAHIGVIFAIMWIGPGSGIAIFFTTTVFTAIFSVICFKENPEVSDIFFIFCSTLGVAVLTRYMVLFEERLGKERISTVIAGVFVALTAAITYGVALIVGKTLSKFETPTILTILSYLLQYSVISLIICTSFNEWKVPETLISGMTVSATAITSFFGIYFEYLAVCYENPTRVTIILTSEVIMTFVGHFTLFSFSYHWTVLVGAGLIIASCIGLMIRKKTEDDQEVIEDEGDEKEESLPILDK